ncbi:DUF6291 domain-containing protein [Xanthomarina gelatinilytica]|uniref:DUF6291 domain-containing protein n=1 Tax=Xanthomarina gelatinilytica TaxID=1137281 RepID=UPI003AA81072
MERDSAVFYRSFYEASKDLPGEVQTDIYRAMFEYAFYKNEIDLEGTAKAIFTLIKPQLDANIRKYENGKNGGRPSKNENQEETKPKAKNNQEETKPKGNENVSASANASLNYNSNADVDGYAEKVTIAAARDLFLKNEEVVSAIKELFLIKSDSELKEWLRLYHLHLTTEKKSEKTPQDYISHFKSCMKKNTLEQYKNDGFSSTVPKRFDQDLGKLPRVGENTSDGISTFTIEEFKNSLETSSAGEYVKSLYEVYQLKPMKLGFIVDKFILHIKCQGPGNQPKNIKEASKYFNNWCKQEIEKGNLNSYLKHPKKQIGAL